MNERDLFRDSVVTFKSIVLFSVLTILNISVFVFMVFENQMDLIAKNAELESKDKGILLKIRLEEIIGGQGIMPGQSAFDVAGERVWVHERADSVSAIVDTLYRSETVFSDFRIDQWLRVVTPGNVPGWIRAAECVEHLPARRRGELTPEDIRRILRALDEEGVHAYAIFAEDGYILADSRNRPADASTPEEKRLVKKSIFKNSFENMTFYHEVNRRLRTVDLYIPVHYGINRLFVLRPTVPMHYVWMQTRFLYRQCIVIGILVLLVHILFVIANQRFIINPMVRRRTDILKDKNQQIQKAKDELQETYDKLNAAHTMIEDELVTARDIQLSLIPDKFPGLPGYSFYTRYLPAEKVGGDFYDFFSVDSEHTGIMIADAAGHGIPAAFVVAMAKMSFSEYSPGELSPAAMLGKSNAELEKVLISSHYLTACYVILNADTGACTLTRASHPQPVLFRSSDRTVERLTTRGLFIGMIENPGYEETQFTLQPGDRIVFYTDGISEANNPQLKPFGWDRIDELVRQHGHRPVDELGDALISALHDFVAGNPFEDDITLLVVGRD